MTDEERVFYEALKQTDPEARRETIARACGGNVELRRAVESLLAAHELASRVFDSPPARPDVDALGPLEVLALVRSRTEDAVGTCIGSYELIERIGQGAMGCVYVAEQQYPLRRTVALKLIKTDTGSRHVVARFEAERQALAMMDHPCIAKVLEAGSTESGRPYFVMELVRGTPITRFCQDAGLNVVGRLRLFVQVCRAVQHAHGKGIIHRDLKPTNILVTVIDGQPIPKVIDFGIAKAMAQASPAAPGLLDAPPSRIAGTPMYMSPEQAAGGEGVDTRSDVYGLGALLYELLADRPPFDRSLNDAAPDEVRRVLTQEMPPPPSQVMLRPIDDSRHPASARSVQRWLRHDLDWIVAKAMCKDPAGRYQTADALAADVERALAIEPVLARTPTVRYVLSKFLRRHRRTATAVAAVAIAVSAGTIGTAVGWVHANLQRDDAIGARVQAMQQKELAEATTKCLQDMFAAMNPWESTAVVGDRGDVSFRQMLDVAAERLQPVGAHPQAESAVRFSLGLAYQGLGYFEEAEAQLRQALQLQQRATAGRDDHELARRMSALCAVLPVVKRLPEAERLAHEVVAMRERLHGKVHPEYARALDLLASTLRQKGALRSAAEAAREALHLRRTLPPYPQAEAFLARSLAGLALVLERSGDDAGAIPLLREALEIDRRTLPADHPRLANTMCSLASILDDREGGAVEATQLYVAALQIRRRHRPEHHDEVRNVVRALLRRLQLDGEFEKCEALLIERKARLGERISNDDMRELCGQFASLFDGWGRAEESRRWQDSLHQAFTRQLRDGDGGGDGDATAVHLTARAATFACAGRFDEAAALFAEATCLDPERINPWCNQGLLLAYLGRRPDYEQVCRRMVDLFGHSDDRNVLIHLLPPCLAADGYPGASELSVKADLLESLCQDQRQLPIAKILKGIARYRCRDNGAALLALVEGRECEYTAYRAAGAFFESLVNRHLGQSADAELAFQRGSQIMRELPKPGISDITRRNLNPWFVAHLAQREAAAGRQSATVRF